MDATDFTASPREFPQFGRSTCTISRKQDVVFRGHEKPGSCRCNGGCGGRCGCGCGCGGASGACVEGLEAPADIRGAAASSHGDAINQLLAIAGNIKQFGFSREAALTRRLSKPDFHVFSSLIQPFIPAAAMRESSTILKNLWRSINVDVVANLAWLSSLGDQMARVLRKDIEPPISLVNWVDALASGHQPSCDWVDAVAVAMGFDGSSNEGPSDIIRAQPICGGDPEIPTDIYVKRWVGQPLGVCGAVRTRKGRPMETDCRTGETIGDIGAAWGFACTTVECLEATETNTLCVPALMPQPQGRPGDSSFELHDITYLGGKEGKDIIWIRRRSRKVFRLVNVAYCKCTKAAEKQKPPTVGEVAIGVLFLGLIIVGGIWVAASVEAVGGGSILVFPGIAAAA